MRPFFPKLQQSVCPSCKYINSGHAADPQCPSVMATCANCDAVYAMDNARSPARLVTEQELAAAPPVHLAMLNRLKHLNRVHRVADVPSEALLQIPERLVVQLRSKGRLVESPPHLAWSLVNAFRHNDAVRN